MITRDKEQDEALVKYLDECGETQDSDLCCGFIDGWDKADETMIPRTIKWVEDNIHKYVFEGREGKPYVSVALYDDLRKAMKGGEA